MATRKLFNARTQAEEDAEFTVDENNEIVATFKDGGFIKFPAGLDKEAFESLIEAHHTSNLGQEVITPEMEAKQQQERANSLALLEDDNVQKETQ